jgi:OOP family OmpA-OmpF porin
LQEGPNVRAFLAGVGPLKFDTAKVGVLPLAVGVLSPLDLNESEEGMSPRRSAFSASSRRRWGSVAAAVGALATALAASPDAAAQSKTNRVQPGNGDGVDLHLFRPALDSKGFFSVNGADILGHLDFSLGLILDYGYGQMKLNPGHGADYMLTHAFQGTLQFDLGILNYVVVGISAPVILNGGDGVTNIGPSGATYNDDTLALQALGHIAAHVKVRILKPNENSPLGLAIVGQAGYEIGGSNNFGAEPGFFYWPQLVLEKRFFSDKLRLGLNAGYRGHTGQNAAFGNSTGADGKATRRSSFTGTSSTRT